MSWDFEHVVMVQLVAAWALGERMCLTLSRTATVSLTQMVLGCPGYLRLCGAAHDSRATSAAYITLFTMDVFPGAVHSAACREHRGAECLPWEFAGIYAANDRPTATRHAMVSLNC